MDQKQVEIHIASAATTFQRAGEEYIDKFDEYSAICAHRREVKGGQRCLHPKTSGKMHCFCIGCPIVRNALKESQLDG